MKFTVLTLFPEMVEQGLHTSILGRAIDKHLIELRTVNIRDYTEEKHGRVDDYTYGGGAGMLMQAQPVYDAWKAATGDRPCRTVYVTPQGRPFSQRMAADLSHEEELVILCGHYEGIDDRVLQTVVTDYVSIGDYVLTGGELPAMVLIDAIARLVPGVLHNDESAFTESFHRDLLEYPQFSRPEVWNGMPVPEVLLSGDHRRIEAWRLGESGALTAARRPELYQSYRRTERLVRDLLDYKRDNIHLIESLRRGRAELLYDDVGCLLLYDPGAQEYYISGWDELTEDEHYSGRKECEKLLDHLEGELAESCCGFGRFAGIEPADRPEWKMPETLRIVVGQVYWQPLLEKRFGAFDAVQCRLAVYTQRCPLAVRHKDIRPLEASALEEISDSGCPGSRSELAERLEAGALYGIYADGTLLGWMGVRRCGSLGMLFIRPEYRRQGYASALEAYCINRQLEQGMTPYLAVPVGNQAALELQNKLGLYFSGNDVWDLRKSEVNAQMKCSG